MADGPVRLSGLEYLTILSLDSTPLNVGLLASKLSRSTGSRVLGVVTASLGYTGVNLRSMNLLVGVSNERTKDALMMRSLLVMCALRCSEGTWLMMKISSSGESLQYDETSLILDT